jgi:hypothetical protein
MSQAQAEQAVTELLVRIQKDNWFKTRVPHGFEVERIESIEEANVFASALRHLRVTVTLKVLVRHRARRALAGRDRGA